MELWSKEGALPCTRQSELVGERDQLLARIRKNSSYLEHLLSPKCTVARSSLSPTRELSTHRAETDLNSMYLKIAEEHVAYWRGERAGERVAVVREPYPPPTLELLPAPLAEQLDGINTEMERAWEAVDYARQSGRRAEGARRELHNAEQLLCEELAGSRGNSSKETLGGQAGTCELGEILGRMDPFTSEEEFVVLNRSVATRDAMRQTPPAAPTLSLLHMLASVLLVDTFSQHEEE